MKQTLHRVLIRGMFLIAIGISLLLTVTHVTAQTGNTVYQGQTTELAAMNEGDFYTWELYNTAAGVNFATDPGNCPLQEAFFIGGVNTGANVFVNWVMPGVYYFKVTAVNAAGGNNLK
ncbi:MAG: hypothetical protein Q8M23_08990, partial [Bacteroidales bacterium]|nr:hypothetical protein [Bacteroidales bacterium]